MQMNCSLTVHVNAETANEYINTCIVLLFQMNTFQFIQKITKDSKKCSTYKNVVAFLIKIPVVMYFFCLKWCQLQEFFVIIILGFSAYLHSFQTFCFTFLIFSRFFAAFDRVKAYLILLWINIFVDYFHKFVVFYTVCCIIFSIFFCIVFHLFISTVVPLYCCLISLISPLYF